MKICEGYITQSIIYQIIKDSKFYDEVYEEFKIPLNPNDPKKRKSHKVDILCINNKDKVSQLIPKIRKNFKDKAKITPRYVATPFPPLNFNQTGNM